MDYCILCDKERVCDCKWKDDEYICQDCYESQCAKDVDPDYIPNDDGDNNDFPF